MKKIFNLVRVMLKTNIENSNIKNGFRKNKDESKLKTILKYAGFIFLFVYLFAMIYIPANIVIKQLAKINQTSIIISLLYLVSPILILYIAFISIPGVFYFAKDIDSYLHHPINPIEIIAAKFIAFYIQILLFASLFMLPVLINYFIIAKPGLLFILISLINLVSVSLIPIAIALLINAIIMRFIPFFKNKDLYTYISTGLALIPTFYFVMVFGASSDIYEEGDAIVNSIINMDNNLSRYVAKIFPNSHLMSLSTLDNNIFYALLILVISIIIVYLILILIQSLYFSTVIGLDEHTSKKKKLNLNEFDFETKIMSVKKRFILNDFKRIIRTPIFLINYLSVFIILPLFSVLPLLTDNEIKHFLTSNLLQVKFAEIVYQFELIKQIEYTVLFGFIVGVFIANLELSSSTAVSREGHALKNYLSLPIRLSDLVHAKANLGILISLVISSIVLITAGIVFRPKVYIISFFTIALVLGILLNIYISIFVDTLYPRLNWVNEQDAIKGNIMQIVVMIPFFILPAILFFLAFKINSPYFIITLVLMLIPIVNIILHKQISKAANTKLLYRVQNL